MKVVLVNHSDTLGGASVVTYRLMHALRRLGVDARMLVTDMSTDDPAVIRACSPLRARIPFMAEHLRIFAGNGFTRDNLFDVSIATDGLPLSRHPLVREADAVVLNWVNQGMLSLDEIGRIAAAKPLVWTMHDLWPMTGICHYNGTCDTYTTGCRDCRLLHSRAGAHDLSASTFARKARLYSQMQCRFVAVSSWVRDCARRSILLADKPVEVIPNPFFFDEDTRPMLSREQLGLPADRRLLVMCAARLDVPIKGLPTAIEALNSLGRSDIHAVFVGALRNPGALDGLRVPHTHIGLTADQHLLKSIYRHSDIVITAADYETFGATLVEGQAAGAMPVGFAHDGRADIIDDGVSGYAASTHDARGLSDALARALDRPIPREELQRCARKFAWDTVGRQYISLLQSIT